MPTSINGIIVNSIFMRADKHIAGGFTFGGREFPLIDIKFCLTKIVENIFYSIILMDIYILYIYYIRKNRDVIFSILAVSCFRNLQLKVNKIKITLQNGNKMVIQM